MTNTDMYCVSIWFCHRPFDLPVDRRLIWYHLTVRKLPLVPWPEYTQIVQLTVPNIITLTNLNAMHCKRVHANMYEYIQINSIVTGRLNSVND